MTKAKRIAIVAGHFPPSNLAAVHRSRLWSQYLPEFGWEPIIVTTHWKYYEETLDPTLLELISPELRVIRTKAIPVKPVRLVGDIGVRALYWHLKELDKLVVRKEIDFVHITIPSNYSALLGELLYRRHRFPFGIDYIDPWVHVWPGTEKRFSKAWVSCKLADWLESWAVKNASLITGVAPRYYEAVLERNPHLRGRCLTAAMPYGGSEADYKLVRKAGRETFLFPTNDGLFHMIYAGALLPKAYVVLERLLEALAVMRDRDPEVMERLRIHFVGTGKSPDDPEGHNIRPRVQRLGLERWVDEHPNRIGYADVLHHLVHASAILILGSTEAHYTPSKVYQAVQAKRPIFALLHEESTAVSVLRESRTGQAVTFTEDQLPEAEKLAGALAAFVRDPQYSGDEVRWDAFEAYSARNSARVLAGAVENALQLFEKHRATAHVNLRDRTTATPDR
jgi:hypothetical protein